MTDFRALLGSGTTFTVTCELVPGRGFRGKEIDSVFKFSEAARDSGLVHAVSLTDNPGGNPAILTDEIARELVAAGVQVIMHFSLKDVNRGMVESRAYSLMRQGIRNLLVLSGDYPTAGAFGVSQPVFDLDSVGALALLKRMNAGLVVMSGKGTRTLEPTDFFLGGVTSPFKWREASSFMQYAKLSKKVHAGARFIISQLGFDSWKHAELIAHARRNLGVTVPILGSVYLLTAGGARLMRKGEVPGCFVSPALLARIEEEATAEDKGRGARRNRAALQVAILKGLGYQGAHIEGLNLTLEEVQEILGRAGELAGSWQDRMEELRGAPPRPYYILRGTAREWMSGAPLRLTVTMKRRIPSPLFWLTQALHWFLFHEGTPGSSAHDRLRARRSSPTRGWCAPSTGSSAGPRGRCSTAASAGTACCRTCSSSAPSPPARSTCAWDRAGATARTGTAKHFPDRMCAWERVYWRAKRRDLVQSLQFVVPPRDWRLYKTASWLSYFLRKDHQKEKVVLPANATEYRGRGPRP